MTDARIGQWYHGSPLRLDVLKAGSTITQNMDLARIFSHRPEIVSIDDAGHIMHNGSKAGYLYVIDEEVGTDDVFPHPRTTMHPGNEWLIARPLRVALIGSTTPQPDELLTDEDIVRLRAKLNP